MVQTDQITLYSWFVFFYIRNIVYPFSDGAVVLCYIIIYLNGFNLRFDVEKECSKIDECDEENNSKSRLLTSSSVPQIETTIDLTGKCWLKNCFFLSIIYSTNFKQCSVHANWRNILQRKKCFCYVLFLTSPLTGNRSGILFVLG